MDEKEGKKVYKKQQKLSAYELMLHLPNLILITISAICSAVLLVWLDFLESFAHVAKIFFVLGISNKLKKDTRYEYNYGGGKVEAIGVLCADMMTLCGIGCMLFFSVYELMHPRETAEMLIYVVVLKLVNVGVDGYLLSEQRKLKNIKENHITENGVHYATENMVFDAIALISLFVSWVFRGQPFSEYVSPILTLLFAVCFGIECIERIREAIRELTDRTLPEKEQMKILKVLSEYFEEYEDFIAVKSHQNGKEINVDLYLKFGETTSYAQIEKLKEEISEKICAQIEHCTVQFIL